MRIRPNIFTVLKTDKVKIRGANFSYLVFTGVRCSEPLVNRVKHTAAAQSETTRKLLTDLSNRFGQSTDTVTPEDLNNFNFCMFLTQKRNFITLPLIMTPEEAQRMSSQLGIEIDQLKNTYAKVKRTDDSSFTWLTITLDSNWRREYEAWLRNESNQLPSSIQSMIFKSTKARSIQSPGWYLFIPSPWGYTWLVRIPQKDPCKPNEIMRTCELRWKQDGDKRIVQPLLDWDCESQQNILLAREGTLEKKLNLVQSQLDSPSLIPRYQPPMLDKWYQKNALPSSGYWRSRIEGKVLYIGSVGGTSIIIHRGKGVEIENKTWYWLVYKEIDLNNLELSVFQQDQMTLVGKTSLGRDSILRKWPNDYSFVLLPEKHQP